MENRKPNKILDAACGPARILLKMRRKLAEAELTGIDIDPKILSIARKITKNNDIELIHSSITQLPFKTDSFDVVISSLAFHHLANEDRVRAYEEIFRIIKPGGEFLLYDIDVPVNRLGTMIFVLVKNFEKLDEVRDGLGDQLKAHKFTNIKNLATDYGCFSLFSAIKPL